ncbi:hypothetical protein FRB98_004782, partial [Tulasnella sp. 332]
MDTCPCSGPTSSPITFTINTFGFRHQLDSRLLHSLGTIDRSALRFTADSGMARAVSIILAQTPAKAINCLKHQCRSQFISTVYELLNTAARLEEPLGYQPQRVSTPKGAKEAFEHPVNDMEA